VISAVGLLWAASARRAACPRERGKRRQKRALCIVAVTFFLLAAYIALEAIGALVERENH
jgi:hypothetical protein